MKDTFKVGDQVEFIAGLHRGKSGVVFIAERDMLVVRTASGVELPASPSEVRRPVGSSLNIPMPKKE